MTMQQSLNFEPSGAYFHAFLQLSKERMPQLRAQNPNITPSQARFLLLDIWRRMRVNERKWYTWRAVKGKSGFHRKKEVQTETTNLKTEPMTVVKPTPVLTEDGRASRESRTKSPPRSHVLVCSDDPPTTVAVQKSKEVEKPRVKTIDISFSPPLDRVRYAKDKFIRRSLVSKSASPRKGDQAQFHKQKKSKSQTSLSCVGRVNFSELANYWTQDRSLAARNITKRDKVPSPEKENCFQGLLETNSIVGPARVTPAAPTYSAQDITKPQRSPTLVPKQQCGPSNKTSITKQLIPNQTVTSKKLKKTSALKPLFCLTAIGHGEDDTYTMEKIPEEKEQEVGPLVKHKTTDEGVKYNDVGSSSLKQKPTRKVTGFGKLKSLLNKNKTKKSKKYIDLSPRVSQIELVTKKRSPEPVTLPYHHLATLGPTVTTVKQATSNNTVGNNLTDRVHNNGHGFTSTSIKKVLNTSNNSNEEYVDSEPRASAPEDKKKQRQDNPDSAKRLNIDKTSKDYIISIPCQSMIDNFSELAVSSEGESADNVQDTSAEQGDGGTSAELLESLLNNTYNSLDASIAENAFGLHESYKMIGNLHETNHDIKDVTCSFLDNDDDDDILNTALLSNEEIERLLLSDDPDVSVDPVETARATGMNSPERQNEGPSMDNFQFLYCSESPSECDVSDLSNLLLSDVIDSNVNDSSTKVPWRRSGGNDCSSDVNIFDRPEYGFVSSDHSYASRVEDPSINSLSSTNNLSILSKAMKKAGLQFPQKNNDSFRKAMRNPVSDLDHFVRPSTGTCLVDLLNEDDSQDTESVSAVSSSSSDAYSDLDNSGPPVFMMTSTPIKKRFGRNLAMHTPVEGFGQKLAKNKCNFGRDISKPVEKSQLEENSRFVANSSEEDEIVENIYTTSEDESDGDYSEEEKMYNVLTSALDSTGLSQISDIGHLDSSVAFGSDSALNNLNFTDMMERAKNSKQNAPLSRSANYNVTWHPAKNTSLDKGFNGNTSTTPLKRKMRRSIARTNLLNKFDDVEEKGNNQENSDDTDEFVKRMIQLGDLKSPLITLRPEAKNDEIYRVKASPRRRRYSRNPSKTAQSQFWASRQYIEETEKAVYNLLKAEFSSPEGSF